MTTLRVGRALDHLLDPLELPAVNGRVGTTNGVSVESGAATDNGALNGDRALIGDRAPIDGGPPADFALWEHVVVESHQSPFTTMLERLARTRYRLLHSRRLRYQIVRFIFQCALVVCITWLFFTMTIR